MGQNILINLAFLVKISHKLNRRLKGTCLSKNKTRQGHIHSWGA